MPHGPHGLDECIIPQAASAEHCTRAGSKLHDIHFAPKQETTPSSEPIITRPCATAGELLIAWPISYDQISRPFSTDTIYSRPSSEPTTTRSRQITGEASTLPRVAKLHR